MLKLIILFFACMNMALANEIEFTVHHAPGGPSDKITRLLSNKLSIKKLNVVNRPGAHGKIAVRHLLNSNSMMIATVPQIFVTNFLMSVEPGYQEDDLEIVYHIGAMPNVLVCNNKLGFKTYKDFLATDKSLNFGVAGYGSSEHLATEFLFKTINNQKHVVIPYAQGGAASLHDLLNGTLDCMFGNLPLIREHAIDGKRITALISSHNVNLPISNWQQEYKVPFPFQGNLALVVPRKLNQKDKEQIIVEFDKINNSTTHDEIRNIGIFPVMRGDIKSIQELQKQNARLKELIVSYNIQVN